MALFCQYRAVAALHAEGATVDSRIEEQKYGHVNMAPPAKHSVALDLRAKPGGPAEPWPQGCPLLL
jgi:hypothetical protein